MDGVGLFDAFRGGGEATLYRDGADTGAAWTVQDTAESYMEWTRVTCGGLRARQ